MKTFWRISQFRNLSGEGALYASGRWHSKGNLIVYLAENPAGAMLERLVHLPDIEGPLPRTYDLLKVSAPDHLEIKDLLPLADIDWRDQPQLTRRAGDAWLSSRETALARVPSAIVSQTWNILLNPAHPQAVDLQIVSVLQDRFDNRLFSFAAR